jgi:hypothetical protein
LSARGQVLGIPTQAAIWSYGVPFADVARPE